jgi:plasmid replication initiation protein
LKAQEEQFELSPVSKKDSKDLVYKSNVLVNGKYDITMVQARFLVFVSSLVNAYDENLFTYQIQTSTVLDYLGIDRANIKWLVGTLTKLQTSLVCLQDDNEAIEYATFLGWFRLDKKNDLLEFRFDASMKPHYLQLKNNFVTLEKNKYLDFTSMYTVKFYEYIKYNYQLFERYKNNAYREFEVDLEEFTKQFASTFNHKKGVFEVPKSYKSYSDFRKKVLEVAQKELKEKNDIYFEFEEIKVNRAVKRLLITIKQNGQVIKKNFADKKKKELQSTAKHKQIAQEQIKRLMSRNKDKIKEPLKYEQKLFGMYLNNTLIYDKDLQEIIEQLDKKIFDSL